MRELGEEKRKQDKAQSLFALRDHSFPQCGQRLRDSNG
jgi:hypothetical protein